MVPNRDYPGPERAHETSGPEWVTRFTSREWWGRTSRFRRVPDPVKKTGPDGVGSSVRTVSKGLCTSSDVEAKPGLVWVTAHERTVWMGTPVLRTTGVSESHTETEPRSHKVDMSLVND